jgi:hypothetical protein
MTISSVHLRGPRDHILRWPQKANDPPLAWFLFEIAGLFDELVRERMKLR